MFSTWACTSGLGRKPATRRAAVAASTLALAAATDGNADVELAPELEDAAELAVADGTPPAASALSSENAPIA
ncbi:hypothetical protein SPHINGO361_120426 [Sphingomonas sp. EC-HK361]|nr:hypothetical protein SPHINGO361_120426 [Sphingomonas sp. EC-HK361]